MYAPCESKVHWKPMQMQMHNTFTLSNYCNNPLISVCCTVLSLLPFSFFLLHRRFQSNSIGPTIDSVKKPSFTLKRRNSILIALFAYEKVEKKKPTAEFSLFLFNESVIFIRQCNDWKVTKVMEFYELFLMDVTLLPSNSPHARPQLKITKQMMMLAERSGRSEETMLASALLYLWEEKKRRKKPNASKKRAIPMSQRQRAAEKVHPIDFFTEIRCNIYQNGQHSCKALVKIDFRILKPIH